MKLNNRPLFWGSSSLSQKPSHPWELRRLIFHATISVLWIQHKMTIRPNILDKMNGKRKLNTIWFLSKIFANGFESAVISSQEFWLRWKTIPEIPSTWNSCISMIKSHFMEFMRRSYFILCGFLAWANELRDFPLKTIVSLPFFVLIGAFLSNEFHQNYIRLSL